MQRRGFMIPGLAMAARELPTFDGVVGLENPEVGDGITLEREYTLEEVAELHVRTLRATLGTSSEPLRLCGMSMGGMILAIIATEFRSRLPAQCRFHFFVTTPNTEDLPAIPDILLEHWATARRGVVEDFERVLAPFFGAAFLKAHPATARAYFSYRALGENKQSGRAFFRQMNALRSCPAHRYFARLDPKEAKFVGGAEDQILGPQHNRALASICPDADHDEVESLGHMINMERIDLMGAAFEGALQ